MERTPKFTKGQILCGIADGFQNFDIVAITGFSAVALLSLKSDDKIQISEEQISWVGAATPLMALLGSLTAGRIIETFGRRKASLLVSTISLIGWIFLYLSTNATQIIVVRFLHGLCLGIQQVSCAVYVSETIHPKLRSALAIFPIFAFTIGYLILNTAGFQTDWRGLAIIGAILHIPLFVLMATILPETPYFMLKNGDEIGCLRTLKWLKDTQKEAQNELKTLQKSLHDAKTKKHSLSTNSTLSYFQLTSFTAPYRWPMFFALSMHFFQQSSGIGPITTFASLIFKKGQSAVSLETCSMIATVLNFVVSLCTAKLYSIYPRKYFIRFSSVFMSTFLILLSVHFFVLQETNFATVKTTDFLSYTPAICYLSLLFGFCAGWAPLPWMFIGEGLPLRIRGEGAGIITAFNWGANFFFTKSYIWTQKYLGEGTTFLIYGICIGVGGVFIGKSLPEIYGFNDIELETYYRAKYEKDNNKKKKLKKRKKLKFYRKKEQKSKSKKQ